MNLVCLTLTLSRTAVIAVLVVFAVTFVLSPPSRRFAAGAAVATIALLYASTAFQSYAVYERMGGQVRDGWSTVTGWLAPVIGGERPGDTQRTARNSARPPEGTDVEVDLGLRARVSSGSSLAVRVEYIKRGIAVFEASPIVGQGSASLTTPTVPWSSAHMSYLTLLARYGIVGAAIYAAFLLAPLAVVWRRGVPPGPRLLVTLAIVPLLAVYLSYDIFMSFEVQYIFFGLVHAVAAHRPWATQAAPARHA